ncbi:glycosyltransferase family 4 protein [Thalassospira marina]|uniref:Glycosyltransferase family 1 protein n=1 Tax=Thalassospira marina TaxID=2048283 RepID=A0ABM6QGA3_9PROT|nr:glycosyltransferase family 4 protein [Thalassospira marina]AUG55621.1 glycosyltransferase family 1 protein [Thalassospira marina]
MSNSRTPNAASKRKKLLFVCSEDWYFVSHRMALARAAQVRGWEIVVACRKNQAAELLLAEGFRVIDLNISRGGLSPVSSLKTVSHLISIFRREKPDVIVNVAIQCVILSTLAGLLVGARRIVNMVTGLGFVFVSNGRKAKIIRAIVCRVLRFYACFKSVQVIVQNQDDEELMAFLGFRSQNLSLIRGSGVDMQKYFPVDKLTEQEAQGQPKTAIFVARMLWSKGLGELVAAIRLMAEKGVHYRFLLVGDVDLANPDSATVDDLETWQKEGLVEWLGKRSDIPTLLQQADLAVLPSWREGLPKSLIEAAACRLAMIATDVPGCREIVRHNDTGLLVKLGDAQALADAIERLMENNDFRNNLAANAYFLVKNELCDAVVVQKTLQVIEG